MHREFTPKEARAIKWLIFACVLAWLFGWRIPLMEIDAVQYANISREMLLGKHFIQIYDQGKDYLDKPPMLFWLSSLSMYLWGISDAAYRLPSFLFAILTVYSTYRFTLIFYKKEIAWISALVLAGSQAMFLINHDVRTDTMLMGWVMLGIWQLAAWFQSKKWSHFFIAVLAIAGGLMTKGPIALMVPVFAFSPHFILKRDFKKFFHWEYLLALVIIGILLIPMDIGLYRQFDLHPEKILYGRTGTSGLKFFYWTQSFGRITGSSTWHENDSFFFLFSNLLWGFLPWTLFFIGGLISELIQIIRKRFRISADEEWISTGGFVVTYCALAISHYQLPHYIYVVLPLAAIITGKWIYLLLYSERLSSWKKPLFITHAIIYGFLAMVVFILIEWPFPPHTLVLPGLLIAAILWIIVTLVRRWIPLPNLLVMAVLTTLLINIFLDNGFYPPLLKYQLGNQVSTLIAKKHLDKNQFYVYHIDHLRSLDFYSNHSFTETDSPDTLRQNDYILTNQSGYDSLPKAPYEVAFSGYSYHVSILKIGFLNPATRLANSEPYYILRKK
ncbi:MAG: glycosyltransferase family 39 protein [Bacteroidota bacterium]|nr:glycosyltransferase family 39 protein [Bacteroidota bacterium]